MDDLDLFVGRYRYIRQLGAGGMGIVFEAEDQVLNKVVAIKTIKRGFSGEHIMRFDREAKALAALNHPNLVALYIFGVNEENEPYMVMRMERGTPLSELIEQKRLPMQKALIIFRQICQAMQHAHDRQVFHRDLKPSNILVRDLELATPTAVIIDFGVAMVDAGNAIDSLTKTGMMVGTPAYMSPEQVRGQEVDGRTDVYALGCIMFETLTGFKPFVAASALEVLGKKISKEAPLLNSMVVGRKYSKELEAIIAKCLAQAAAERYSSMHELNADLDRLEDVYEVKKPADTKDETQANKKKIKMFALIGAIAIVPVVSILAIFLWEPTPSQTHLPKASTVNLETPIMSSPLIEANEDHHCFLAPKVEKACLRMDGNVTSVPDGAADDYVVTLIAKNRPQQTLALTNVPVTGTFLESYTSLPISELTFNGCAVDSDGLKNISKLPNLASLEIQDNHGVIPPAELGNLRHLTNLKKLMLQGCDLGVPHVEQLAKIKQIEELDLSGNAMIDDRSMPSICKLSNLRTLVLDNSHVMGGDVNKYIPQIRKLTSLSLKGLMISDADITALTKMKLENLNVENTALTQRGLKLLSKIKTMKHLMPRPDA